jgi:hypothetical protein
MGDRPPHAPAFSVDEFLAGEHLYPRSSASFISFW